MVFALVSFSRLAFRVSATKHPAGRSSPLSGCISPPLDDMRQSGAPHVPPEPRRSVVAYPAGASTSAPAVLPAPPQCHHTSSPAARCPRGHFLVFAGLDAQHAPASLPFGLPAAPLQRTHPLRGYILGAPGALRSRAPPKHLRAPLISRCASHIEKSGNPGTSTALSSATPHSLASLREVFFGGAREQAPWGRFRFAAPHSTAGRWGALWSLGAPASNGSRVTSPRARWAAAGRLAPFSWRRMDPLTRLFGRQCLPNIAAASP